jgi:Fe-S-cluster containining protein
MSNRSLRPGVILANESEFSYTCGGCGECCRTREVYLNPYDVARLALTKKVLTSTVLEDFLDAENVSLKRNANGECICLASDRCGIYGDRPLACRLYPLARRSTAEGAPQFTAIPPEPKSTGVYGSAGTVATYRAKQESGVFERFADAYFQAFRAIARTDLGLALLGEEMLSHLPLAQRLLRSGRFTRSELFDIDQTIGETTLVGSLLEVETRAQRHIKLLHTLCARAR